MANGLKSFISSFFSVNFILPKAPRSHPKTMLEVCVDNLESVMSAVYGGADELELCSALGVGGLTPSPGLVRRTITALDAYTKNTDRKRPKLNVMIRCRPGSDFNYTEMEIETMIEDMKSYQYMGVDRFVFGCLNELGFVDEAYNTTLVEEAKPMPSTFHRAYDVCYNPHPPVDMIREIGFDRILTSGKQSTLDNEEAVNHIRHLIQLADGRIDIVPGGGLNFHNALTFLEMGCRVLHSSCKMPVLRKQLEPSFGMEDHNIYITDQKKVLDLKALMNEYVQRDKEQNAGN